MVGEKGRGGGVFVVTTRTELKASPKKLINPA